MTSIMIVWISIGILAVIFIIAVIGIVRANKINRAAMSTVRVACAGSVDKAYPSTVQIKIPANPETSNARISLDDPCGLSRFIVMGNSMQYANIHANDLVYVRGVDVDTLRLIVPKITLLRFKAESPEAADRKIRRTWSIVNYNIDDAGFRAVIESILANTQFKELRDALGEGCPPDEYLIHMALDGLNQYKKQHQDNGDELLISTTFRTERARIEFSIHPSSSLEGIVAYVSHPLCKRIKKA